jgi:hypothetical protein
VGQGSKKEDILTLPVDDFRPELKNKIQVSLQTLINRPVGTQMGQMASEKPASIMLQVSTKNNINLCLFPRNSKY